MALKYVQTNTLFLAGSGSVIGATSIVLTGLTDIYGNVLTLADFGAKGYGTLEPDTNNEEAFTFTSVTSNTNGTVTLGGVSTALARSPYTETSALIRTHSGGTKVVITDNVAFWNTFPNKNNTETISGTWAFATGHTPTVADAPASGTEVANKTYVDAQVAAGAPDASATTKGITKLDTAPAAPTSPIAVGSNSARLTTMSGGATSSSNKIVDTDSVATTGASKVLQLTAGGKVTTSTIDTGTSASQIVQLDGSAHLPAVDGSALTNLPASGGFYARGQTTLGDNSATVTIAHGLGKIPKMLTLKYLYSQATSNTSKTIGTSNATGTGAYGTQWTNSAVTLAQQGQSTSEIMRAIDSTNGTIGSCTLTTLDATNIVITQGTKPNFGNNWLIQWQVFY